MQIINNDWEYTAHWSEAFLHGGEAECRIRIPHTVKEVPLHGVDPASYQGIVGYRHSLQIPASKKGKRFFLQFDGAAHIAEVYFNGELLAVHRNGYTGFRIEITDHIHYGADNTVTVKLDTRENPAVPPFGYVIDYLTYGGIYRNVYLDEREADLIQDVFVTTPDLHTVDVQIELDRPQQHELLIQIYQDTKIVAEIQKEGVNGHTCIHVDDAQSWSPEHPNLYTCCVSYGADVERIRFGFRTIEIKDAQLLLNGEAYFVRGLNRHQCFPYIGYAAADSLQIEDARILKEELGVNAVRTSHYPQSHAFIDACDELGLLVFTEIPGWQHIGNEAWQDQAVENTKEMVKEYRNHVSIFLWGVRINESMDNDAFYARTNEAAHELDPSRPTSGVRYLENSSLLEDVYGYNDFSHMGNNPGCKKKKDVMKDTDKALMITEANGHMFPTKPWDRWERLEEHALRHARVMNDAMADHEHIGVFQWCMFDYATHKDFGSGDRICYHGVLDSFRNPKPAAYVYASQSDNHPVLEVCSPMDIGDYNGGHLDTFYVFTNADEVRMYKNDDLIKTFHSDERFAAMKHGPVKIDDTIGDLLKTKEGLSGTKEKYIHDALLAAQKYGMADLPKKALLEFGWCMLRYHMKYDDGVALYGKYVGGWGGDATVWKFEAYKDGKCIQTVTKAPNTEMHLEVKASSTILHEGDCYDMASFRLRLLDQYNNQIIYAQLPASIEVSGPIEIVGPSIITLEGGMGGTYIRTTGEPGDAAVTITTAQTGPVTIHLIIEKKGDQHEFR